MLGCLPYNTTTTTPFLLLQVMNSTIRMDLIFYAGYTSSFTHICVQLLLHTIGYYESKWINGYQDFSQNLAVFILRKRTLPCKFFTKFVRLMWLRDCLVVPEVSCTNENLLGILVLQLQKYGMYLSLRKNLYLNKYS